MATTTRSATGHGPWNAEDGEESVRVRAEPEPRGDTSPRMSALALWKHSRLVWLVACLGSRLTKVCRPLPCPPLDYLAYGRGIFQVVLALFFFRLGLMMQRWNITILQSDYSVDFFLK